VGERAFDVGLRSPVLGLRGRLDVAIAVPDRATPDAEAFVVEYKDSEKPPASTSSFSWQPMRCCWRKHGGYRYGAGISIASRCGRPR